MVWVEGLPDGPSLLKLYGETRSRNDSGSFVSAVKHLRGPRPLTPDDLPDLVTFADITNPKSVMAVDPHDLSEALNWGVSWRAMTIELTNEPVTSGIEQKLPWLTDYSDELLDGSKPGQKSDGSLASRMNTTSFRSGL